MATRLYQSNPTFAATCLLFVFVLVPGCTPQGDSPPITPAIDQPADQADVGTTTTGSATKPVSNSDATQGCALASTDVVPGTSFSAPKDDAQADGWQTETLSSAAGNLLKELAAHLAGSHKEPKKAVAEIVAKGIAFSPLRPEVSTVFEDAAFTVTQAADPEAASEKTSAGAEEFQAQLESMLNFVSSPQDVHAKIKIIRVEHNESELKTSALVQFWGKSAAGAFQSDATWDCEWTVSDEGSAGGTKIQLTSLGIRDYVTVIGQKVTR